MPTKRCTRCGTPKGLEQFNKNRSRPEGLDPYCKQCLKQYRLDRKSPAADFEITEAPPLVVPGPLTVPCAGCQRPIPAGGTRCRPCEARPHDAPTPTIPHPGLVKILFIPDCHIPYHDSRAWELLLKAARVFQPEILVVLGDFMDCYTVSQFDKSPGRANTLKYEVGVANEKLDELDKLGARRKIYLAGNHEDRLERYIIQRAPALFGMVQVQEILRLRERGWEFYPYKHHMKIGKLHLCHDAGKAGRNAARQAMEAFQGSVVIGHTHRFECAVMGNADGPPAIGAMFGWLGDFDQVDYMHQIQARRDWAHGFGTGYLDPATGIVYLQPVPIVGGSAVVAGQLVR